jgi:hypothetical protein
MHTQVNPDIMRAASLAAIAHQGPLSVVPADIAIGAQGHTHAGPGLTARAAGLAARAARRFGRYLAALWRAVPGPWPVKALLVALAVAEPGPFGELALVAYANAVAAYRARRAHN